MQIVIPRELRKNKLFLNKSTIPLKSELEKIEKIKAENGKVNTYYHYNVYVEIDKRVAIEKNIQNIKVNITNRSLSIINNREALFDGVDTKDTRVVNLLATNASIFRVNAAVNNGSKNNLRRIGSISSDSVFDNKSASKIKNFNLPDHLVFKSKKKRYILKTKSKNLSNQKKKKNRFNHNFLKLQQKKRKKRQSPKNIFKLKYNKLLNAGKSPATLINKGISKVNQSAFDFVKGRINNRNLKPKKFRRTALTNTIKDIATNSSKASEDNIASDKFELVLEEGNDRNAMLKQKIRIHEKQFAKLKKGNLRIIFVAKNDKGVSLDVTEGFLNHSSEKKKLLFPDFDFSVESAKNYRGDIRLQIRNNEKQTRSFNIYALKKNNYSEYSQQPFQLVVKSAKIKPKSTKTFFKKNARYNDKNSIFFRINPVHDGVEYANSKFVSYETKSSPSKTFTAGLSVISLEGQTRHSIEVNNIPSEAKRVQVVRRNLSKSEKHFSLIKNENRKKGNLLKTDVGKQIRNDDALSGLTFFDDDLEKNNVYEYKARIYNETGSKKDSLNSFIVRYAERSGLLEMQAFTTPITQNSQETVYRITGAIKKKQTDSDKVFTSLFGRFFDLFEEDLKQIKDLNAMTYDTVLEIHNKDNGEFVKTVTLPVDKDGVFREDIRLPSKSNFLIKIIPRAIPPAQIIAKINNTMPFLAKKARFLPVSAYNTAAIKRKASFASSRRISEVGIKYADRLNRRKGKIVDNKTKLQSSNFDLYFDGETGDNVFLEIFSRNKIENKNPAIVEGKIELIKSEKSNLENFNNANYESGKEMYVASFIITGVEDNLDFLIMSYSENGNISTEGLAYVHSFNTDEKRVNFIYELRNSYGKMDFYAQPVTKTGNVLDKIKIGTILKDDLGVK